MKNHWLGLGIVCAIFFTANPPVAFADVDAPQVDKTKKASAIPPLTDKQILTHLYLENLWEAHVDQFAQLQAASQQTRDLAGDFMKDHAVLAKEMRAQAGRLGIRLYAVPKAHSSEGRKAVRQNAQFKKLKQLNGQDFDRRYKGLMTTYHAETIQFIERQRTLLPKDSPVFSLLAIVLPKIQDHYDVLTSTEEAEP